MHAVKTTLNGALTGQSVMNQKALDELMCQLDGTPNKSQFGANAILGVSMAVTKAAAANAGMLAAPYLRKRHFLSSSFCCFD